MNEEIVLTQTETIEQHLKENPSDVLTPKGISKISKKNTIKVQNDQLLEENKQLKEKISWFEDAVNKKDKLNEANFKENQLLRAENAQILEKYQKNEQIQLENSQLKQEISQLKQAVEQKSGENQQLLEKMALLDAKNIENEHNFAIERAELIEMIENLKKAQENGLKSQEEHKKKQEEPAKDQFFLNPVMKIILYMLLAIYVSFYIGVDRVHSLFRKK